MRCKDLLYPLTTSFDGNLLYGTFWLKNTVIGLLAVQSWQPGPINDEYAFACRSGSMRSLELRSETLYTLV